MKKCTEIQKRLLDEGQVGADLQSHLAWCAVCRDFLADLEGMRARLRTAPRLQVPAAVSESVYQACREELQHRADGRRGLAWTIGLLQEVRLRDLAIPLAAVGVAAVAATVIWIRFPELSVAAITRQLSTSLALVMLAQNLIMLLLSPLVWKLRPAEVPHPNLSIEKEMTYGDHNR